MTHRTNSRFFLLSALAAALLLFAAAPASAVTVFSQDFEGGGMGCPGPVGAIDYAGTCQPVSGGTPFWEVTTGDNLPALTIGGAGNSVLGAAGDGATVGTGDVLAVVPFGAIDISAFTNLVLSVDVAATAGAGTWETEDYARVYYRINEGMAGDTGWANLLDANGPGANLSDPSQGGIGNPTLLTAAFQTFVFNIPDGGAIRFLFAANVSGSNEQLAFDNLDLQGDAVIPEPSTIFLFGAGLVGLALVQRKKRKA